MGRWLFCASLISVFAVSVCYGQASGYFLDRMPTVPKGSAFVPASIADPDYLGGVVSNSTEQTASLVHNSTIRSLPGIAGNNTELNSFIHLDDVNSSGAAVGGGFNASSYVRGIYWDSSGNPWELIPALGQGSIFGSYTAAISENNIVVGQSIISELGYTRAMLWKSQYTSDMTVLPVCYPTVGWESDEALAISSNSRFTVGDCSDENFSHHAVRWTTGATQPQILGGPSTEAFGVNDSGNTVGLNVDSDSHGHPAVWDPSGRVTTLGGIFPNSEGIAYAINNSNAIVGYSCADAECAASHATLWTANGKVVDLNKLMAAQLPKGVELQQGMKITDSGRILVSGFDSKDNSVYYQLTPVIATSIKISSNINPADYGQGIHLVASLIPATGDNIPKGSVEWYDNGTLAASARLTAIGTASWEPSTLMPGKHHITVKYSGHSPNGADTSAVFNQTINATPTRTTVGASVISITHGQPVRLIATVVPTFGTISGTVTFKSGRTTLGTATLNGRTKQANLTTTFKTAGKYSITATYDATTDFLGSKSSPVVVTAK